MSEIQQIESALRRAARRRRWDRAWRGFWQGLLAGGVLWLLALLLYKLAPIPYFAVVYSGLAAAALMPIGFLIGWLRRPTLSDTARWVDYHQHLDERLSTALEIAPSSPPGNWKELVLSDASRHVRDLDPKKLLPLHLPKASQWALIVLALSVGLGFAPEYRSEDYQQRQREKAVMRETGRQMAKLVKRELVQREVSEPVKEQMESAVKLGDELSKAKLTRSQALQDLAKVNDRIKQDFEKLNQDPAIRRMQQAARSRSDSQGPDPAGLQKKIEQLKKSLGENKGDPEQLEKLKKDLERLQRQAANFANNEASQSANAREQLAQSLNQLSNRARDLGANLPDLEAAMEALKASQIDQFLKDLDLATQDLEKMAEMAKALQKMQQMQNQIGKNLGEQLEYGQAEVAQGTLKKMIEKLQNADLSSEELQKMMEEVAEAVDPASPYGKVAEHLKKGASQMKSGQKQQAAESLAKAAEELDQLMQQMANAESMLATLKALQKAQMCVGTCQGWGQCQLPGFNPNGQKPGAGVGTWSDSSAWLNNPQTQRWDNSGIQRPDMDPRGLSDRGDGKAPSDKLNPTKVQGKFSQGSPMPSITLKGVSIKGQSRVEFEESALSAQSEARSALNQEKVPRAYQGAVRDYFDDLKE